MKTTKNRIASYIFFIAASAISLTPALEPLDTHVNDLMEKVAFTNCDEFSTNLAIYSLSQSDINWIKSTGEKQFAMSLNFLTMMYLKETCVSVPSINLLAESNQQLLFRAAGSKKIFFECKAFTQEEARIVNLKNTEEEKNFIRKNLLHPQIIGDGKFSKIEYLYFTNFSEMQKNNIRISASNLKFDFDGVLRKIPLLYEFEDGYIPSSAFLNYLNSKNAKTNSIIVVPGKYISFENEKNEIFEIPIDKAGNLILNFDITKNGNIKKSIVSLLQDYRNIENENIFIIDENAPFLNFYKTPVLKNACGNEFEIFAAYTMENEKYKIHFSLFYKFAIIILIALILEFTPFIKNDFLFFGAYLIFIILLFVFEIVMFFTKGMLLWTSAPLFIIIVSLLFSFRQKHIFEKSNDFDNFQEE